MGGTMSSITINGDTSGSVILQAPAVAGSTTLTLPTTTGTLALSGGAVSGTTGSFSGDLSFNSGYGSAATAYGCRAWVKFNGTGTVSITASGGVTSITDNGTGDYTVNFSITFPDANYALGATCDADTVNGAVCYMNSNSAPTTTTCRLATKILSGPQIDRERIMALFIR